MDGSHSNLARCRLDVFWDSLCFDSGCMFSVIVPVEYFGAYYGLKYYINMHVHIHKQ